MTRFVSRVSDHVRRVVRPIIQRLPFARPLLASYRQARARLVHFAKQQLCSAQNLGALRALSNRRFNALAVGTARPVGEPPNWPYIDISVVSYNSARWVASFVQSLCAQHYPLERMHLIWVDHGSTDATLAAQLDCAVGEPLLMTERLTHWDGQTVTYVRLVHRPGHRMTTHY